MITRPLLVGGESLGRFICARTATASDTRRGCLAFLDSSTHIPDGFTTEDEFERGALKVKSITNLALQIPELSENTS